MSEVAKDVSGAPNLPYGMTWDNPTVQFTASKEFDPDGSEWPHQMTLGTFDFASGTFDANVEINLPNNDCQSYEINLTPEDFESHEESGKTREQALASVALKLLEDSSEIKDVEIAKKSTKRTGYRVLRRIFGGIALSSAGALGLSLLVELVDHNNQNPLGIALVSGAIGLASAQGFARSHESYLSVKDSIKYTQKNKKAIDQLIQEISSNSVQIIEPATEDEQ